MSEIFLSIQGEAADIGRPSVFIRLSGCPLRCRWCDTAYAFHDGKSYRLEDIEERVAAYGVQPVCLTGGEPLAQKSCRELAARLATGGYAVSIETSGTLDIGGLDPRVRIVMDVKAPGSGESRRNRIENIGHLRGQDQVKFVLADRTDYEWSRAFLREHVPGLRAEILFSPVAGDLSPRTLAEWILEDRLPVRLQIQLHKLLWGNVPGR